jgi:protein involved in polysaccharide export with SLBB domain
MKKPLTGIRPSLRAWAAALLLLAGCTSPRGSAGPIPGLVAPFSAASEPYRIQVGDELEIRFFHTPDQNVVLPVRPDGFISVPLAHEVRAAGRTPEELRLELVERCSRELAEPEIAVIVRTFAGYQVHVGGEVDRPGVLELASSCTVLQAVFGAGGFLPTASLADVVVVRRGPDGSYALLEADLDEVLEGDDASGNFFLQPFDVVYVPPTRIADVNKWVDQYLRRNIPISFGFSYRINPDAN